MDFNDDELPYFVSDRPRCARGGALLYYASLDETVDLSCLVDAFPAKGLHFTWTFVQKVGAERTFISTLFYLVLKSILFQ